MIEKTPPLVRLQLYYKLSTEPCEVGHQLMVSVRSLLCCCTTDLDSKMAGNSFGRAQPSRHTTDTAGHGYKQIVDSSCLDEANTLLREGSFAALVLVGVLDSLQL